VWPGDRCCVFVSPAFEMGDGDDCFWGKARPFGLGFTRVWKPTRADDNDATHRFGHRGLLAQCLENEASWRAFLKNCLVQSFTSHLYIKPLELGNCSTPLIQ